MEKLTGMQFGRLTVLEHLPRQKGKGYKVRCRCECGQETVVFASNLKRQHTTSCGCHKREVIAAGAHTVHGMRHTRLYEIWRSMKQRCKNPNKPHYSRYGGRGITVCTEWDESFEAFQKWALEAGYDDTLTLERKDNDAGYSPENCVWATVQAQANNRRSNRYIELDGERHTIAEWSRITGIKQGIIISRLKKGWPARKVLETK